MDLQNASLAGGVVVGTVAELALQPYGAMAAGSVAGVVATFGYQVLQVSPNSKKNSTDCFNYKLGYVQFIDARGSRRRVKVSD